MTQNYYSLLDRATEISDVFLKLGYVIDLIDVSSVLVSNQDFRVWIDLRYDLIWIGNSKTFDRWANSRDYEFEGIPDDLPLVMEIAATCRDRGIGKDEDDFSPHNLNQYWRKAKKNRSKRDHEMSEVGDDH